MENKKTKIEIRKETFPSGKFKFWIYKNDSVTSVAYTEKEAYEKFNELVEQEKVTITIIKSIEI